MADVLGVPPKAMEGYSVREMMAIAAAREVHDGEVIFCGTGISMLAAMAAKHLSAPQSVIFFETGSIDPLLEEIPMAVADPRVMYGSGVNAGLAESFGMMQNRRIGPRVVAILGAAQIDPYGNLNSTAIGDPLRPAVRFSGSGGACDAGSAAGRTIVFMAHEKRRFVPQLDYFTTPGYMGGPGERERAGYPPGGPVLVVTEKALLRFDERTCRMYLDRCCPGITPEQVQEHTGFPLDLSRATPIEPPTAAELRILRETVDPQRLMLG